MRLLRTCYAPLATACVLVACGANGIPFPSAAADDDAGATHPDASPYPDASSASDVDAAFAIVPQVVAGGAYACALDRSGTVYCWGAASALEWALPPSALTETCTDTTSPDASTLPCTTTPARLPGLPPIAQLTNGSCALDVEGQPWCWGGFLANNHPETPRALVVSGAPSIRFVDLAMSDWSTLCGLTTAGAVICWDALGEGDSTVEVPSGALAESLGNYRLCVSTAGETDCSPTGSIFVDGTAPDGSDAGGTAVGGFVELHTTFDSGCGRMKDGAFWCWGSNDDGLLATPGAPSRQGAAPVPGVLVDSFSIAYGAACAIHDGDVSCWGRAELMGDGTFGDAAPPCPVGRCVQAPQAVAIPKATSISVSTSFAIARLEDGRVMTWGSNLWGQLGHARYTSGDVEHGGPANPTPTVVPGLMLP